MNNEQYIASIVVLYLKHYTLYIIKEFKMQLESVQQSTKGLALFPFLKEGGRTPFTLLCLSSKSLQRTRQHICYLTKIIRIGQRSGTQDIAT